jgi:hypothetical protein
MSFISHMAQCGKETWRPFISIKESDTIDGIWIELNRTVRQMLERPDHRSIVTKVNPFF